MVRQAHHPEPSRRANHNDRNSKFQTDGPPLSPSCRLYPPAQKPYSPTYRAWVCEPEAGLEAELEAGGSILKRPIKKMTERSDIHKYSIFNSQ